MNKVEKNILWIISGPTSVGKSTFLQSPRYNEITGLSCELKMLWYPEIDIFCNSETTGNFAFHYNILHPLSFKNWKHKLNTLFGRTLSDVVPDFGTDVKWTKLADADLEKKAVILVTKKDSILQRARERCFVEQKGLTGQAELPYPRDVWLPFLETIDLAAAYEAWRNELKRRQIPYLIVDSSDQNYSILDPNVSFDSLVNGGNPDYSKEDIKRIIKETDWEYHKVTLPYGLQTPGADRTATRDLIFPPSFKGKTVLDIGCALGYFCFEAETRSAAKVIGIELRDTRFSNALLLKDIKDSNVEFRKQDIIHNPINESFDYIFILNVIHHLHEPVKVLRQLALMTRECMVIEFPTIADEKFAKSASFLVPWYLFNKLRLIAVSSLPEQDQTFVFTPEAIKRIFQDHDLLFKKIDIIKSPIKNRVIMICREPVSNYIPK